ncbi:4-oxalocrotonate tautomerase [Herbaspirillum sp. RTI4]|uniref:tautomerase family protein n=1 Tax=Herbaspirillum sp. RTI4 TaxID=3048640 RepID=UPI002AB47073|nr:4-oxalocrotonate tautomerase [Herbaspirillum sp. RTI4]MDY7577948.1 4-oxalocrotonate tautomerase [Herbaspirillum sp. RTI4]MEA9981606.1 4-oxalocrotonate tautomerase [Herbaspirillum sp. RTI4]
MPILNVKVSAQRSNLLTQSISEMLLDLTTRILRKRRELIAIAIDYIDPEDWIIGGSSLLIQNKNSFYFDIKITDESNTKEEKAEYIKAVFEAFSTLLGNLHDVSYIYVQDVRGSAYGYEGETQEYRFHHPVE